MPRHTRDMTNSLAISRLEEAFLLMLVGRELDPPDIILAYYDATGRELSGGSVYPTLRNLAQRDFVTARWSDETFEEGGGSRRRYYSITPRGKAALEAMATSYKNFATVWRSVFEGV